MGKYTELVAQLLENEKISQEEHDQLVDLSAAKEAIKEFNSVKAERDELAAFKARIDTAPKRKEALKRVGVDYDAQPKYGQKTLDSIPADKLDDLEFVASFVKDEGFEANLAAEGTEGEEKTGAEEITDFLSSQGTGQPPRKDKAAEMHEALKSAKTEEEAAKILAAHGQLDTD